MNEYVSARLQGVAERRVGERFLGSSGVGLSGGEQRRLALACALAGELGELKALLADEPTTGLDTFQAKEMVELLSDMGRSQRCATIMCHRLDVVRKARGRLCLSLILCHMTYLGLEIS